MSPLYKEKYFKTYKELKAKNFELFWCNIHIPHCEYEKMTDYEIISLKIRNNNFVFEEVK